MCTRSWFCKDCPYSPTGGLYAQSWLEVENNSPRVGETEQITTVQVAFHTRLTHFPYQVLIVIISCIISSPIIPESSKTSGDNSPTIYKEQLSICNKNSSSNAQ